MPPIMSLISLNRGRQNYSFEASFPKKIGREVIKGHSRSKMNEKGKRSNGYQKEVIRGQ